MPLRTNGTVRPTSNIPNPTWVLGIVGVLLAADLAAQPYTRQVDPFPVRDAAGVGYTHPLLGGLNVPRPQFYDIDADGDLDLFIQERTGALMFFENTGTPAAHRFTWRTDAYADLDVGEWARLADLDGDGDADVLAEQRFSFVRYFRNDGSPQEAFFTGAADTLKDVSGEPIFSDRQNLPALADIDCDARLDLFIPLLDGHLTYYAHEGVGTDGLPRFRFVTDRYQDLAIIGGFGKAASDLRHGAAAITFSDVDRDGDHDLFWGDFFSPSLYVIENTGTCAEPVLELATDLFPAEEPLETRGYNAPAFADLDDDGDDDLFAGVIGGAFGGGPDAAANFYFYRHTVPGFALQTRQLISSLDVDEESMPVFVDLDGDADLDLIVGNKIDPVDLRAADLFFFRNEGSSREPAFRLVTDALVDLATRHFNTAPAFADLDDDGDADLLVGGFDGTIAWYRNDGTVAAPVFGVADTLTYVTMAGRTRVLDVGQNSTPALVDHDGDGDLDLFVGEASGVLNLYRNVGTREAARFALLAEDSLRYAGIDVGTRSAPVFQDVTGDGLWDLVVGAGEDGVFVYHNMGLSPEPAFVFAGVFAVPESPPLAAPAFADVDADGDADLFLGNRSGGLFFYRNDAVLTATETPSDVPEKLFFDVSIYPNPFRDATTLGFRLARGGQVRLVIYDVLGRVVAVPVDAVLPGGAHALVFDAGALPSGVYLYALTTEGGTTTGTLLRVR